MANETKPLHRKSKATAIRQSVTIPVSLAVEVRRVAKRRNLTISRAVMTLAERGVRAELDAKKRLEASYRRFLKEKEPAKKEEPGKELIRAIFGADAIAKNSLL